MTDLQMHLITLVIEFSMANYAFYSDWAETQGWDERKSRPLNWKENRLFVLFCKSQYSIKEQKKKPWILKLLMQDICLV